VATSRRKVMRRVSEEEISRFIKSLSLIELWLKGRFSRLKAAEDVPEGQRLVYYTSLFFRNTG
jgi:hypothetical protein